MQCFGRCGISKSCGTVECDSPSDVQGSRKEPKLDENNLFELITFDSYDKQVISFKMAVTEVQTRGKQEVD